MATVLVGVLIVLRPSSVRCIVLCVKVNGSRLCISCVVLQCLFLLVSLSLCWLLCLVTIRMPKCISGCMLLVSMLLSVVISMALSEVVTSMTIRPMRGLRECVQVLILCSRLIPVLGESALTGLMGVQSVSVLCCVSVRGLILVLSCVTVCVTVEVLSNLGSVKLL